MQVIAPNMVRSSYSFKRHIHNMLKYLKAIVEPTIRLESVNPEPRSSWSPYLFSETYWWKIKNPICFLLVHQISYWYPVAYFVLFWCPSFMLQIDKSHALHHVKCWQYNYSSNKWIASTSSIKFDWIFVPPPTPYIPLRSIDHYNMESFSSGPGSWKY